MSIQIRSVHFGVAVAGLAVLATIGCRTEVQSTDPAVSETAAAAAATAETAQAPTQGTTPADRDQVDPDGVVRRGVPLGEGEAIDVAQAWARAAELDGTTVTVRGTVDAVCSKKGCWMAIVGEDTKPVRVTFKDYGFFVPRKSSGLTAIVQGTLQVKTLDVETAQHFEDDRVEGTGEPPKQITEPQRELAIVASGVELRPS